MKPVTPFYPVSLNLKGRRCVVVGARDDREAIEKAAALEESGADLLWVTDPSTVVESDFIDAFFVISTPQDERLSARLREYADRHRFLLCCIDQPRFGFVAMAAIAKAGPVRISVSTTGLAPRLGKNLKEALQRAMDGTFERFIECLATQKERIRHRYSAAEQGGLRRKEMIRIADGFDAEIRFRYPEWFEEELALSFAPQVLEDE